ncbi:hypothetical protein ACOME3_000033 [Neoechinorhynchus agilis]
MRIGRVRQSGTKKIGEVIEKLMGEIEKIKDPDSLGSFNQFPITSETKDGLRESGYIEPSRVQRLGIIAALKNQDVLCAAKTGSGKTLAFIVPLLEKLYVNRWSKSDGLGALVISPTRELAFQIFETLTFVGKYHDFSAGVIFGGKSLKEEAECIARTNIIICTPGRLLQHMDETYGFDATSILMLVLDEADRILDLGFSDTMQAIMDQMNVPSGIRQTLLYSATQTSMVNTLVKLSLKNPVFIQGELDMTITTPLKLKQVYTVIEDHDKLNFIWTFIRYHEAKILIFVHTCKQVMFYSILFRQLRTSTPVLGLCGRMGQRRRLKVYEKFREKDVVALFATDIAARGLDFPNVDWVIQMDCPCDVETYIHRVGRTARYEKGGKGALILTPPQQRFLEYLTENKVPIKESPIQSAQIIDVSKRIQTVLDANNELKLRAKRALRAYLKAIHRCSDKEVFNANSIDVVAMARSFAIDPPKTVKIGGAEKRITVEEGRYPKLKSTKIQRGSEKEKEMGCWFQVTQFDDL